MGVPQDAVYLESGLIAETGVTSSTPPVTVITSPVNGAALSSSITITGISSVTADAVLFGVEVSTDGGTTWNPASGTTNWSFSWNPDSPGTFDIKARGWDDLGNMELPGSTPVDFSNYISVTYDGPSIYSVFQPNQPGADPTNGSGVPLEVGMRFRSNIDGYITSLKYYKIPGTSGTHTGNLWANTGGATPLASVTFTNETSSGWQTADLATPLAITASTLYIVSYFSPSGQYPSSSTGYFTSDIVNDPLTAPATPQNGLYIYNGTSAFPSTATGTNYWVDVNFTDGLPAETPPSVISISPINNATGVPVISDPSVTFNEAIDPTTVNSNTVILTDPGSNPIASTVSYVSELNTATCSPDSPLAYSTIYTVTVVGGLDDPRIKDVAGNAMLADYTWSFTTESLDLPSITEHPASQSICSGNDISFSTAATGNPTPTLQWQLSTDDGGSWTDIPGATISPYTFIVAIGDDANQYQAVWTNIGGSTISNPATLTVVEGISGTIDAVNANICQDDPFQLQLTTATGLSPYSIVINGKTFSDVTIGSTFATIPTDDESIWDPSATPSSPDNPTATPYELGVKFMPIADGYIKGIRFYKGPLNTGTHIGNLWTEGGTLLASATFINETSTGWQQVLFTTPVAVTANTTYVASYSDPAGYFSQTTNFFVDNTPVISANELVQTLPSTGNGIYSVTVGAFPNLTPPLLTNYWVDVVFTYSIQYNDITNNITSISDDGTCTVTGNPLSNVVISLDNPSAPIVVSPVNYNEGSTAVPLTATGTNLLWYSEPTGGVGNPVAPTPSTAIPGITSYYVSQTNNGCEGARAQIDVVVSPNVEGWYSQSWQYRRPATMSNTCEAALTDYQVLISLDNSFDFTKPNTDGSDIRITDADGTTLIPFWIESWDAGAQQARIWIKVPTIPLAGSTAYIYYGNSAAASLSDGNSTFILFDDTWVDPFWTKTGSPTVSNGTISFSLGQKIQSPGNYSPGNALGFRANFKGADDYKWVGFINGTADPFTLIETDPNEGSDLILANATTNNKNVSSLGPVTNAFHIYELGWLYGGTKAFIDHSTFPVAELNIQVPTTPLPLVFHNYNDATYGFDVDWVYLRNFVDCEPLTIVAEEQSQIAINIAINNTGCGQFEVKLKPDADINSTLTNIQFTIKWPESTVSLTDFSSTFGVALQGSVVTDVGMNYAVFTSSATIPIDWTTETEYTVLSFSHDHSSAGYADFEIDEGTWASENNGEFYVELLGLDYTGLVYGNAANVYLGRCGNIKALLQGPYDDSGIMNKGLTGNIPLDQPYNVTPWNYAGTESVGSIDPSVVDWVLLELRSDPTTTVEKKAALILEDGSIVQYNNISQGVHFANTIEGSSYHIVVHHRNHMPVMTDDLTVFDGTLVDFTDETICYGTPNAEIELGTGTGIYGMIAGDINSNGYLSYSGPGNDRGLVMARIVTALGTTNINAIAYGYYDADVLMDYNVKYIGSGDDDRSIMLQNLAPLTETVYLNAIYQTPVPNVTTKSESINDGPIHIFLDETENELQVKITTEEDISIGIMDNVQFTLSWQEAINETMVPFLENGYSQYGLLSQGEPQEHNNIMYLTYVSVIPMGLPDQFDKNEEVILISFTKDKPGTVGTLVSITENDFTENNNGDYYISLLGTNYTGTIQTESMGMDDLQVTGIKIYPNPLTSGVLYLETKLKRAEDITVTVLDIQGKTITSEILNMNAGVSNNQIDLKHIPQGMYFIKVEADDINAIQKLIIH